MPRQKPMCYAVAKGHVPGIYDTWAETKQQVDGFSGAVQRGFITRAEAEAFLADKRGTLPSPRVPPADEPKEHPPPPVARDDKWSPLEVEKIADETGWDVVYIHGCSGQDDHGCKAAGLGVWWGPDDPRNLSERCPGVQTHNHAELVAMKRVLEAAVELGARPLLVKSRSEYAINAFREWGAVRTRENYVTPRGRLARHRDLAREIMAKLDARARAGQVVHLQFVGGPHGERNTHVVQLAQAGWSKHKDHDLDFVIAMLEGVHVA